MQTYIRQRVSESSALQAWISSRNLTEEEFVATLGEKAEQFTLTGHSSPVRAVAITPNGKQVVSASIDNTLKVWDLESGTEIASFSGDGALFCCAVVPDGVTIVAGEASGRVHFLRLEGV